MAAPFPPAVFLFRLQSFNFPKSYVRHQGFQGEVTELGSPDEDFLWNLEYLYLDGGVPRVRIQSKNYPGYYLRHQNFRVRLQADDTSQQFSNDSTFLLGAGLTGISAEGWHCFESVNFRTYFIRHRDGHLYLDQYASLNLRPDATFRPLVV